MPYGSDRGVGESTNLISPVLGSSLPTLFAPCTVNQSVPFWSKRGVCGSGALAGSLYSVTLLVLGSSLPMYPFEFAVNHIFPSLSSTRPCGPDRAIVGRNSLISPVFVSTRPRTFAYWPEYQR